MKAFGTWGTVASYQLGGVIGCTVGIVGIALGGWVPLVGIGVAIVIGAVTGLAINAFDKAVGDFSNTSQVASSFTGGTTGVVVTGAAVAGLAVTALVASNNATDSVDLATPIASVVAQVEQTMQPTEHSTATSTPMPTEIVPTLPPTNALESSPTVDPYGCDNPNLTEEERVNCGRHNYKVLPVITLNNNGRCAPSNHDLGEIRELGFNFTRMKSSDEYENIGVNLYKHTNDSGDEWIIELTLNGYSSKSDSYMDGEFICTWINNFELVDD